MQFSNDLDFEADKPIRVSIFAPVATLSQVYRKDFPTRPRPDGQYAENPAAVELARQIYSHLFNEPITVDSMPSLICHGIHLTSEKCSREKFSRGLAPAQWEKTAWDAYNITFDHLVPAGDEDPQAVQLYVDEDLHVTQGLSKSHRSRINGTVRSG